MNPNVIQFMTDIEAGAESLPDIGDSFDEEKTEPTLQNSPTDSSKTQTESAESTSKSPWQTTLKKWNTSWSGVAQYWRAQFPVKVRKLQDCPPGYPHLAAFLDSDENFMIYRRFGFVQSRLLLDKQNELQDLEKALEEMDEDDHRAQPGSLKRGDLDLENPSERKQLIRELETKFNEYARLVTSSKELTSTARPSESAYRSFRNFLNNRPLCQRDEPWIECKEDMLTLRRGREHAWLDDMIEHLLKAFHCRIIEYFFCSEETRRKTDGPEVYYTRSRIERLVVGIITAMILILLIVPIYVLYHLSNGTEHGANNTAVCIGTLLVFTLAFSAVLSLFTRAKRHEILAAAAAYCAVLVVFLGNVQGVNV